MQSEVVGRLRRTSDGDGWDEIAIRLGRERERERGGSLEIGERAR